MRRFRPSIKNIFITALIFPLLVGLGLWQLDRAKQKRALAAAFIANAEKSAIEIRHALTDYSESNQWLPVKARGKYLAPNILLDNRVRNGRVGYEILTPMQTADVSVLVNRGWVPAPPQRDRLPNVVVPTGEQMYSGKLGPVPTTGLAINQHSEMIERLAVNVLRIQQVNLHTLGKFIGRPLFDGVVYLDEEAANGYQRDWRSPGFNRKSTRPMRPNGFRWR